MGGDYLDYNDRKELVVKHFTKAKRMIPQKHIKATVETIGYFSVGSPVFYMKDNKVNTGHIQAMVFSQANFKDDTEPTYKLIYKILPFNVWMEDLSSCDSVSGDVVAINREELLAKL